MGGRDGGPVLLAAHREAFAVTLYALPGHGRRRPRVAPGTHGDRRVLREAPGEGGVMAGTLRDADRDLLDCFARLDAFEYGLLTFNGMDETTATSEVHGVAFNLRGGAMATTKTDLTDEEWEDPLIVECSARRLRRRRSCSTATVRPSRAAYWRSGCERAATSSACSTPLKTARFRGPGVLSGPRPVGLFYWATV
jgi:hypothetical protein